MAEEKNDAKKPKTSAEERELCPELKAKLEEYRAGRGFNADDWIEKKCAMYNDYMSKCGLKAAVVSISGGIDSAVTLALVMKAKSMEGSPLTRVLGVCQPIHSSDWALNRAKETAVALGAESVSVDQTELHNQLSALIDGVVGVEGGGFAKGQLRSYMRTPSVYYIAQIISQSGSPCVVMGTGNQDEDGCVERRGGGGGGGGREREKERERGRERKGPHLRLVVLTAGHSA